MTHNSNILPPMPFEMSFPKIAPICLSVFVLFQQLTIIFSSYWLAYSPLAQLLLTSMLLLSTWVMVSTTRRVITPYTAAETPEYSAFLYHTSYLLFVVLYARALCPSCIVHAPPILAHLLSAMHNLTCKSASPLIPPPGPF